MTALAPARSEAWAILDRTELWRERDGEWDRVADLGRYSPTCIANIGDDLFVGTSEAHLQRLSGDSLEPVPGFDQAEGRSTWYTPWGGPPATRSIANWDDDIYVNVHVGGILRSTTPSGPWRPTIDIDADVHQVTTAEGLVLAACAGGLASSADLGENWTFRTDGLEARYSRAVVVCGDSLLVSASHGPRGGRAAVYRAGVSDGAFERCLAGPGWFEDNIDSFCLDALRLGPLAAFGTSDGDLYVSDDSGSSWTQLASALPSVNRVLVLP